MEYKLHNGESSKTLKEYPDNYFSSVVCDPPYFIDFLGKDWDKSDNDLTPVFKECLRVLKPGGYLLAFSASRTYHKTAMMIEESGFEIRDQIMWLYSQGFPKNTKSLKPAHEPIVMARKIGKSMLNIDECRIPYTFDTPSKGSPRRTSSFFNEDKVSGGDGSPAWQSNINGRFPSNVIGEIDGYQKFYYQPKINVEERGNNNHPTVKPIDLMRYLCKLVTPSKGIILDPFMGSGTTGIAAIKEGFNFVGIEMDKNYFEIAKTRIEYLTKNDILINELFK